jgi:hypothetical protein
MISTPIQLTDRELAIAEKAAALAAEKAAKLAVAEITKNFHAEVGKTVLQRGLIILGALIVSFVLGRSSWDKLGG